MAGNKKRPESFDPDLLAVRGSHNSSQRLMEKIVAGIDGNITSIPGNSNRPGEFALPNRPEIAQFEKIGARCFGPAFHHRSLQNSRLATSSDSFPTPAEAACRCQLYIKKMRNDPNRYPTNDLTSAFNEQQNFRGKVAAKIFGVWCCTKDELESPHQKWPKLRQTEPKE